MATVVTVVLSKQAHRKERRKGGREKERRKEIVYVSECNFELSIISYEGKNTKELDKTLFPWSAPEPKAVGDSLGSIWFRMLCK